MAHLHVTAGGQHRALRVPRAGVDEERALEPQKQGKDSGRAGQVGPAFRISHARRAGALLASARQ